MDTILIVDDSSFIVDGLIAFLKKKYRPLAAYGGEECLEILRRETPSVIILDIMMEPMDGWETLSRIKENPQTRYIPVLMFSAIKISPEEAESHRVSIDDCLTKPVSPNKIVEAIEKVLARRDTHRMITERWQSAGIPQEKIDEYLSLVTSLEVDLSLCQNMRLHYDLLRPKDKNEAEFQTMIKAIEERVLQERNQIEALGRAMNETLEKGFADAGKTAGPEAARGPGEPERPAGTEESRSYPPPGSPGGSPAPVQQETAREEAEKKPPGEEPARAESPEPGNPSGTTPVDILPGEPGPGLSPDRGPPVDSADATNPGSSASAPSIIPSPGQVPEAIPLDVPGTGTPAAILPRGEAGTEKTREPGPGTMPAAVSPGHPATADQRNVIPANPDIPLSREGPGTAPPTGAGTDIPMPWGLPADRKSQELPGGPDKKTTGTGAPADGSSEGFFARVLSFVRSMFRK